MRPIFVVSRLPAWNEFQRVCEDVEITKAMQMMSVVQYDAELMLQGNVSHIAIINKYHIYNFPKN